MWHSIIIGILVSIHVLKKIENVELDSVIKRKLDILKYKTVGVLLWPIVFYLIIPKEESSTNKLIFPFLWPFLLWFWDSYLLTYGLVSESSKSKIASSRIDPSTISSMSFALFGMLGGTSTGKHSYIFLCSILLCIAFVFPSHNLASGSPEDLVVEAIQKTILIWALGLMFSGVIIQNVAYRKKIIEQCAKSVEAD